jgi:short-subunit dehydrogenase
MDLGGKTVLLSGATGGIGRAIAQALAGRGAHVLVSSRKREALDELAASLPGDGHRVLVADLAEEGAAERLVAEAGEVDVLVANAGLPGSGTLDSFSQEEVGRALRVNLEAPIRMTREMLPAFRERGSGHFVYVSSLAGKTASPRTSIYAATKFGLRGFALALREDLRSTPIGASVVLPGFIRDAGMFADSGAKPPPGLGTSTPQEVAAGVLRAIDHDRGEVQVAPRVQRLLAGFAHRRPELAGRIQQRGGAKIADAVARGQADKR